MKTEKLLNGNNSSFEEAMQSLIEDSIQCAVTAMGLSNKVCHQVSGIMQARFSSKRVVESSPYIVGLDRAQAPQYVLDAVKALNQSLERWNIEQSQKSQNQ